MATKTLILRPISVTSTDESLVTLYPTDTTMANAHTLVNEEVADDDATYITGGLGGSINYHFSFTKPDDLENITDFSFKVRQRLEASSTASSTSYQIYLTSGNYTLCTFSEDATAYTDLSSSLATDNMNSILGEFNNATSKLDFYITQTVASANKAKPTRTTQLYIEITYQNSVKDAVYLKQNNEWVKLNNAMLYRRYNHSWSLLDYSILEKNNEYLIKEVE